MHKEARHYRKEKTETTKAENKTNVLKILNLITADHKILMVFKKVKLSP